MPKTMPKSLLALILVFVLFCGATPSYALSSHGVKSEINRLLPSSGRMRRKIGIYIKSLKTGKVLFKHNADKLFVPASNAKIIVSATALSLLKPTFRFKTEFYSHGHIENGVLDGDLYIKGYGDPTLHSTDLQFIANEFKQMGINRVTGKVYVDETFFDDERFGKGWKESWKDDAFSPPISALSLNYNTYNVNIYPTRVGAKPRVEIKPEGSGLRVINNAVTSTRRGNIYGTPRKDGKGIIIAGRISPRVVFHKVTKPVANPAIYTGSTFQHYLNEAGTVSKGSVEPAVVREDAILIYTHYSGTLDTIITTYNKESVNIIGENLMKYLGAKFIGEPGSWSKGSWVVAQLMDEIGVRNEVSLVDGSGLSTLNRTSPRSFVEILKYVYSNKSIALDFITSLSISGVDGTLEKRFTESEIQGRVMAKTGYLSGVRTLSGYVFTKQGDVIAFSILSNGIGSETKKIQYSILESLIQCCSD